MGQISGEEITKLEKMQPMCAREEKILVLVRLRPLSEKEVVVNEVADWECINDTTILYRNSLREGSLFPSAYAFGKILLFVCLVFITVSTRLSKTSYSACVSYHILFLGAFSLTFSGFPS